MSSIYFSILFSAVMSCNSANHNTNSMNIAYSLNDSSVVVITSSAPKNMNYMLKNGLVIINQGELSYLNSLGSMEYYKLRPIVFDTIRIKTQCTKLELLHKCNAYDKFSYLLNAGDTLLIQYDKRGIPTARLTNRSYSHKELNYNLLWKTHLNQLDSFSSFYGYISPYIHLKPDTGIPVKTQIKEIEKVYKGQLENDLLNECHFLDSLRSIKEISGAGYIYRKNTILSTYAMLGISINGERNIFMSDSIFTAKYDSLLLFDYYRILLNWKIYAPKDISNRSVDRDKGRTLQLLFDSVLSSEKYSNKIKRYVLPGIIESMRVHIAIDEFKTQLNEYLSQTNDSTGYTIIKNKFGLTKPDSLDISLKDIKNQQTTFSHVVEKHKGKYIYVDFWASWCAPCKQLLNANRLLREKYAGQNIAFVFLAFKDIEEEWFREVTKNKGVFSQDNYYITNSDYSKVLEKLKVKSIPRYLLIDTEGAIIYEDAPRPNTKEIITILDKLLK